MRKDIITIAAASIILIGILGYAATRPAPAHAPIGTDTASTTLALPALGYSEHAPYYDIVANYPTTTPLTGSANDSAIQLIQHFIAKTIAQFQSDGNFASLTPNDVHMLGLDQGRKEKLEIVYLIASSPRTVSYIFTIYEDTLGAHGNMFFRTFTFDTATGAALSLSDVFLSGAPYLDTLSQMSRTRLPGVIGEGVDASFLQRGTTPEEKNFSNFFFDNKDFVILFAPYQVAPYAAGPQTLRIKASELSSILKPEYR